MAQPSTATTKAIYRAIQLRMLTFEPEAGGATPTLAERLPGGISPIVVPDNAPAPYFAIRLQNVRGNLMEKGSRLTAECELMAFNRPRDQADELEELVDVADQAMRGWSGVISCVGWKRDTLPPLGDADDPELVRIRVIYDLIIRPSFLTRYVDV